VHINTAPLISATDNTHTHTQTRVYGSQSGNVTASKYTPPTSQRTKH